MILISVHLMIALSTRLEVLMQNKKIIQSFLLLAFNFVVFSAQAQVAWSTFCGTVVSLEIDGGEGGPMVEKSLKYVNARTGYVLYAIPSVDNSNSEEPEMVALRDFQNKAIKNFEAGAKYCVTGVRGADFTVNNGQEATWVLNFHNVTRQ